MRRIVLGALTGAGIAWLAWRLRGWPPAIWSSSAESDEPQPKPEPVASSALAAKPPAGAETAAAGPKPAGGEPSQAPVEPLIDFDDLDLELAPLPRLSESWSGREPATPTGILAAAERDSAGQSGASGARLALVADDDADIRTLAAQLLEGAGFDVVTAADGDEALRLAIDREPAVCVLDWMMPRRNGLDVLESIRAGAQTRATPVLLLTARAASSDVERGLSAGADGYLTKPFTADQLRERVLELVDLQAA